MLNLDLTRISSKDGYFIGALVAAMLVSPFWFLFQFQRQLILETDFLKIIFISISIGLPVFVLNLLINNIGRPLLSRVADTKERDALFRDYYTSAAIYTCFAFYAPCISAYFISSINLEKAISYSISLEAGIFAAELFTWIWPRKKKQTGLTKGVKKSPGSGSPPR